MEFFEVHITGDESIHQASVGLGLKTISVHLLAPDGSPGGRIMRTEHMTSWRFPSLDYAGALTKVWAITDKLMEARVKICRVKIESPFYPHYAGQARYIESHFVVEPGDFRLPVSRNAKKESLLATDRSFVRSEFEEFAQRYADGVTEVELCLFDSWVAEDQDWFKLYQGT